MGMKSVLRAVAAVLAAAGLWLLADGLWIPAKAALAQHLLGRAWERAKGGEAGARPWPWADTRPVARLAVPRLGVERLVLAGASGRVLAFGPGHHPGTAAPGSAGHTVVSGHRDTHFRFLADLRSGDRIEIEGADGRRRDYRVLRTEIVDHRDARLPATVDRARLTLITCYPFDAVIPGGPLRYLVVALPSPKRSSGFAQAGEAAAQESPPGR
jgi:sortase A